MADITNPSCPILDNDLMTLQTKDQFPIPKQTDDNCILWC